MLAVFSGEEGVRLELAREGNRVDGEGEGPRLLASSFGALEGRSFVGADGVFLVGNFDARKVGSGADDAAGEAFVEGALNSEVDGGARNPVGGVGGDLDVLEEGVSVATVGEGGGGSGDEEGSGGEKGEGDDEESGEGAHVFEKESS